MQKTCAHCREPFVVADWRKSARYCTRRCSDKAKVAPANVSCSSCGVSFRLKPSIAAKGERRLGYFCSTACSALAKSTAYAADKNPNYKAKNTDSDGYRVFPPYAQRVFGVEAGKLHQAVCCLYLGMSRIPSGFHVHHRDCQVLNNEPVNLAVMTVSDHKWLHKQFGVAPLWALSHARVSVDTLTSWSDDPKRAETLLRLNVAETDAQMRYVMTNLDLFA